jgi:tetratricopeptide (TPR) repeat protein
MKKQKIFILLLVIASLLLHNNRLFSQKLNSKYTNEKLYAKNFNKSNGAFLKGRRYFKKEKFKKAEEMFKECLEIFPEHDQANYYLALLMYKKGDYKSAEKCIIMAQKNFLLRVKIWENLHMDHITKLKELRSELVNIANPTAAQTRRIQELSNQINDDGYKKETLPAAFPYIHGNVLLKLKKYREAHGKYLEALKIDPNHGKASNNIATLYYMIKKYKEALKYLNNAEKNGVKVNHKFKEAINKALKSNN